jgi:CO/xanthine dehydrogenase Mo-binding subunit
MENGSGHTGGAGTAYYNAALNLRNLAFKRATTIAPFSTITPANVTTKATATATIANGAVTSITVTNGGSGYTAAPTVIISGGTSDVANATALAVANINSSGTVTSITVTYGGELYTSAPTVTIYSVTTADLDAANSTIFLKSDNTKTATYAQVCSGWIAQPSIATGWGGNLRWGAVGASPIGSPCNTTGSSAVCCELLVDPATGDITLLGYWNATATGTTINAIAVQKEIGSGCESAIGQALFFGDVYDPNTAAVLQMAHGCFHFMTSMDFDPTTFHLNDVQNFDMCGPLGAHGMSEPASTNAPAIQCAIFNATAGTSLNPNMTLLNPKHGSCSQDVILASLGLA